MRIVSCWPWPLRPMPNPSGGLSATALTNAGDAVSKGVEWLLSHAQAYGLSLSLSGSYTDAADMMHASGRGELCCPLHRFFNRRDGSYRNDCCGNRCAGPGAWP